MVSIRVYHMMVNKPTVSFRVVSLCLFRDGDSLIDASNVGRGLGWAKGGVRKRK